MAVNLAATPLATEMPGVTGEFHSSSWLLLAAKIARHDGFAAERMWYMGNPTTDQFGEPMGFVLPTSLAREFGWFSAIIGLLVGVVIAVTLGVPRTPWSLLSIDVWNIPVYGAIGFVCGGIAGFTGGFLSLSAKIGAYLTHGTAGSLRLKIGIPANLPAHEQGRLAELAERALREARCESLWRLDGSRLYNSPQVDEFIA